MLGGEFFQIGDKAQWAIKKKSKRYVVIMIRTTSPLIWCS